MIPPSFHPVTHRLLKACSTDQQQTRLKRVKAYLVALGFTLMKDYYVEPLVHGVGTAFTVVVGCMCPYADGLPSNLCLVVGDDKIDRKGKGKEPGMGDPRSDELEL